MLGSIDRASDEPVFRQVAEHLRSAVRRGQLRPGDQLPSEADLIAHYGIARMTVRQALGELRTEGLVVAEQGRGVFVRPQPKLKRLASDRFARTHRRHGRGCLPGGR